MVAVVMWMTYWVQSKNQERVRDKDKNLTGMAATRKNVEEISVVYSSILNLQYDFTVIPQNLL